MVQLTVNDVNLWAMIDTGSEATLLKSSAKESVPLQHRNGPTRNLKGVSGRSLQVSAEYDVRIKLGEGKKSIHRVCLVDDIDFPGDMLIGMDFLRRFDYDLVHRFRPHQNYLCLDGVKLQVTYTDCPSLRISVVHNKPLSVSNVCEFVKDLYRAPTQPEPAARVYSTTSIPARSARFIRARLPEALKSAEAVLVSPATNIAIIPRSVIAVSDIIHVWCINPDPRPVKLKCGTKLATLEAVEVFTNVDECDSDNPSCAALTNLPVPGNAQQKLPPLKHLSDVNRKKITSVLKQFPGLFSDDKMDFGTVPGVTHKIDTGDTAPTVTRQWRLPHSARQVIREQCEKMHAAGVIEPSISPWMSPVVLVRKKTGDVRFCVDFRIINSFTIANNYPLPPLQTMIDDLHDSKVFTSLDARSAYWAIPVEPSDRPKTAFSDGSRLWQFRRMPYGLRTAPQTFQKTINLVLSSVLGRHTAAYLDDVVIFSPNMEEHLVHLKETLNLLHQAGLRLNSDKCDIAVSEFKFLGFIVSSKGILPDPEKCKAINEMPRPTNAKGVRRFLGATGFFRRHIPQYAKIAVPLTHLTKKDTKFTWTDESQEAFDKLKVKLTTAPALRNPDYKKPFEVHCDASKIAVGACLMQKGDDGTPHAIAYFSRKTKGAEVRYSATDSEALAAVEAVRAFDPYIYGRKFTIMTDHRP